MDPRSQVPQRLAIVLPMRQKGPLALYWERIFRALDERGMRVEFIPAMMKPLTRAPSSSLDRRIFLPSTSFARALARSSAPVFLCGEYSLATLLAAVAARVRGRRVVILQENSGWSGLPLNRWERRYRRLLGVLAHAFVANTDAAYLELADVLHIDRAKIFRATFLVPPERAVLVQDAGCVPVPTRRPLFLFAGRLIKLKNVCGMLDAAAALRARGFEFELWILGDGPERSALEMRARKLVGEGVVRFLGSCAPTAVGAVYEAADVFVMPSFQDYRSVAVLEALRFGKPVIDSTRDGNASDFVRHELTGLVFDPCEPRALEAAMERAITEPDTLRELGRRASELMEKQTPQTAAAALCEILKAVEQG